MTNQDVIRMAAAGVDAHVIITAIRQASARRFSLGTNDLIDLKRAHVPDDVVLAMQATQSERQDKPSTVTGTAPIDGRPTDYPLAPLDLSIRDESEREGITALRTPEESQPVETIRDGLLDEIVLYKRSAVTASRRFAIRPFTSALAQLGTGSAGGKAERQSEAEVIQNTGPKLLADRFVSKLKELGPYTEVTVLDAGMAPPHGTLTIEGRFTEIDPGSRVKRYFVGFGAGKSQVAIAGSLRSPDGSVLATFTHKRIGVIGFYGGDSLGKLTSDTRDIGDDLAKFVSAWAMQKGLK